MLGVMLIRENNDSRLNAAKHGCCAKTLILPGEHQEDFDRISNGWKTEFVPEGYQEERLVEIVILNDWLLQRAQRRLWEAEAALCSGQNPQMDDEGREIWEAQKQHDLELKQRYKTSCERAFYRAWTALQGLRKDLERRHLALARLEEKKWLLQKEYDALVKKYGLSEEADQESEFVIDLSK